LVTHAKVIGLGDPDFINEFVISKFFKAKGFMNILNIIDDYPLVIDTNIQLFNLFLQHLNLKHQWEMVNAEYLTAIKYTKCHIYEQYLKIYYATTFSLNGKL